MTRWLSSRCDKVTRNGSAAKDMTLQQKQRPSFGAHDDPGSGFGRNLPHRCMAAPKTFRQRLHATMNTPAAQLTVVIIVTLDLLLISSLVLIDWNVIQDPTADDNLPPSGGRNKTASAVANVTVLERVGEILHTVQIAILSAFLFEILLRVLVNGFDMLDDRWQIFDCLVVMVTFALYVALSLVVVLRTITYPAAFVISLRLWRSTRVYTAVVERVWREAGLELERKGEACQRMEKDLSACQLTGIHQQKEIESLRVQLRKIQMSAGGMNERRAQLTRLHAYHSTGDFYYSQEELSSTVGGPHAGGDESISTVCGAYIRDDSTSTVCGPYVRDESTSTVCGPYSKAESGSPAGGLSRSDRSAVDLSCQHVYVPTGSAPYGARTPRGSVGSVGSVVSAGHERAPLSAGRDRAASLHSVANFPDVVGHTQQGDHTGRGDGATDRQTGAKGADALMVSIVAREMAVRGQQGAAGASEATADAGGGTTVNSDHEHLLPVEPHRVPPTVYFNSAFSCGGGGGGGDSGGGLTDEEKEIRRVSQVPFPDYNVGSQVTQEDIPMTDL